MKLTEAERDRLAMAIHEAGHSVMGTLLGGRIHTSIVVDGARTGLAGETVFDHLEDWHHSSVAFAGPWGEARFRAGRIPTPPQIWNALDGCGRKDRDAICAAGGPQIPADSGRIVTLLDRCWPAVSRLASRLYFDGEVRHADVCAALGIPEADNGIELATIKSGRVPGTFTVIRASV